MKEAAMISRTKPLIFTAKGGRTLEMCKGRFPEMPRRIKADVLVCPYSDDAGRLGIDAFVKANKDEAETVKKWLDGVSVGASKEGETLLAKSKNPLSSHICIAITDRTYLQGMSTGMDEEYKPKEERRLISGITRRALTSVETSGLSSVVFPLMRVRGFCALLRRTHGNGHFDEGQVEAAKLMVPTILAHLNEGRGTISSVYILVERFDPEILAAAEAFRN